MQLSDKSFDTFQPWPDTTVWPDLGVEAIGIRPISSFESTRNRSMDTFLTRMKSIDSGEFKRVIGSKCEKHSECNHRVPRSYCSYGQRCECLFSYNYDKATDSCNKVKQHNDRCSFSDGCNNVLFRCSEFGLCACHHGFHYEFGKNPVCQPNNSSSCDPGQTWDPSRARCVRPRIHTLFTDTPHFANTGYDRNRYSLFFSVILILVLMVILFKSKKSHPFTWDRRSRRMSRSISYAEALGYAFGVHTANGPNSHASHIIPPPHQGGPFDVPTIVSDSGPVDASATCIPPPPYASTQSLATACATINDSDGDASTTNSPDALRSSANIFSTEKPPTYEEAIRYDTTLVPVATDLNNNLSNNNTNGGLVSNIPCTNTVPACVPGNCRCSHLTQGGFICLAASSAGSTSVNRACHSGNLFNVNHESNIPVTNADEISDVPMIHHRWLDNVDGNPTTTTSRVVDGSNVVISTTQHCTGSHVPYLTPPVHSLPFSARLRDYPYPVSPWPVVQGHTSSRSERYRLHRSSRPMNYGRSHSFRRSGDNTTDTNGSRSSIISFLRRGTTFMSGVTSRNRPSASISNHHHRHRQQQQQQQQQQQSSSGRRLSTPSENTRPHSAVSIDDTIES